MAEQVGPPARTPCPSCPYRLDVPSGVWAPEEYAKLVRYDAETGYQPQAVFMCHQLDGRVCGGWAGCHGRSLLALRVAVIEDRMSVEAARAAALYRSPVPLFASGAAAAEHGLRDVGDPGSEAVALSERLVARGKAHLPQSP